MALLLEDRVVELIYWHGPPPHFIARLGRSGWAEGWGWTEASAIRDLARKVRDQPPAIVPPSALESLEATVAWLQAGLTEPVLDELQTA